MKEKILVVDDDKSMVNMIKDVLEMEGYAVTTAFDGEQALKQVQKQSDIILLDINLLCQHRFGGRPAQNGRHRGLRKNP